MSSSKPHHEADPKFVKWEEEETKQWIFKPRGLNIVWGNDPRYWEIPKEDDDKDKPAELKQVSWLEVTGLVDDQSKIQNGSKYKIEFKVSVTKDMSGWSSAPVFLMAKIGRKGKYSWKKIKTFSSSNIKLNEPFLIPAEQEGPFEITVKNDRDLKIYFGLYEVWSGKWKKGLLIHEAFVTLVNNPT